MSIRETNCVIHWIVIYPVDSAIQRLNNRGLVDSATQGQVYRIQVTGHRAQVTSAGHCTVDK